MPDSSLVIFTASFPSAQRGEYSFLTPEVDCHARRFDRVILVPYHATETRLPLPERVLVDFRFAERVRSAHRRFHLESAVRSLVARDCWREWLGHLPASLYPPAWAILLLRYRNSRLVADWTWAEIRQGRLDPHRSLFYSYWLDYPALALGRLKQEIPGLQLVARAHGADLYAGRYHPAYIPFQGVSLDKVDRLFLNSKHGLEYLAKNYPGCAAKMELAYLGVPLQPEPGRPSEDGVYRLVSCSSLLPVKQVDLLLHGIASLAASRPGRCFEWQHFGDGPERSKLEGLCRRAPPNLICRLHGQVPNKQVLEHYRLHPVDLFLNASRAEGLPVSILEAHSFGIPAVAPAVGGIPEIVSPDTGRLLNPNPGPAEIAAAAWELLTDPLLPDIRAACRANQQAKFNSDANYNNFSDRLRAMLD